MRLLVLGFGTVGRALVSLLPPQSEVSIFSSKGGVSEVPLKAIQDAATGQKRLDALPEFRIQNPLEAVQTLDFDVLVDLSPTNLATAEPSLAYWRTAFERGKSVVTANKGPLAFQYRNMKELAEQNQAELRFEATVAGGTPVFSLARHCLAGAGLQRVEGILNGSTNFILTLMEQGESFDSAVSFAREKGYLEADARNDLEGGDAMAKAVILANALFDQDVRYADTRPEGIMGVTLEDVVTARKDGQRYKLIASVDAQQVSVSLQKVPYTHPLANIGDAWNALSFHTKNADAITVSGRGAGGLPTASSVLNDLLELQRIR
ncbi:homoserine dehydrogenase [Candidatus Micrarchaeota archaeon]|nr:homoserine dehydrogenase [Candidatus Micrarchaeota archaeon]